MQTRRPATFSGESGPANEPRHLIAQPLVFDGELRGAVACEIVGALADGERQHALTSLAWGAAWIELGLERAELVRNRDERNQLLAVLELVTRAAERGGFRRSATALATELASRLGCDRVSVGFVEQDRVRLRAVSHTASFEGKSNLSRAVEAAMDEAYDQEGTVSAPASEGAAFQVRAAHDDLLALGGSKQATSVPFGRDEEIYGVITLERSSIDPLTQREIDLVDVVGGLAGPLLELERRDERGFFSLAWQALRRQGRKLTTPGSPLFKGALVGCALLVLFFSFFESPYRVTADATLEAIEQRAIVAPFGGYVAEAPLRAGDLVQEGDLLCRLDDRDLNLDRGRLSSQMEQYEKRYSKALAERNAAEVNIVRAQIDQITAQLNLTEDRLSRTRVVSPSSGVVVEGDLSQMFGSPVERGQVLFNVAPLEEFRLVLFVGERDVQFLEPGQEGTLVLASSPEEEIPFAVTRITPVSVTRDGSNSFRVEAEMHGEPHRLLPGMEGVGKVETAPQLLIWNWTHEAVDWMRVTLWKWSP